MPLVGAPDFQVQSAATATTLGALGVNTSTSQSFSILANLLPYHMAVIVQWQAGAISAGSPVCFSLTSPTPALTWQRQTTLEDGASAVVPIMGNVVLQNVAQDIIVNAFPSQIGVSPISGVLNVIGITQAPLVRAQTRFEDIGIADGTGLISVPSGATTAILNPPVPGIYHRIRSLSWRTSNAITAGQGLDWAIGPNKIILTETSVAGAQQNVISCDFVTTGQITLGNPSLVAIGAAITFERWNI